MIIIATLKSIILLSVAFIDAGPFLKFKKRWFPYIFLFILADTTLQHLEAYTQINIFLISLFDILCQVFLIMSIFNFSFAKAYVFKFLFLFYFTLPEFIFRYIDRFWLPSQSGLNTTSFIAMISFYGLFLLMAILFRRQIRLTINWFRRATKEFWMGLFIVSLNCDWYILCVTATTSELNRVTDSRSLYFLLIIGLVLVNIAPLYALTKLYRESNYQSKDYSISIAKNLLNDYLKQTHDLKNIAQILTLDVNTMNATQTSVVDKMINLKTHKANLLNILVSYRIFSRSSHTPLSSKMLSSDTLDLAIITGIFLDNAIEHLQCNPNLEKHIDILWDQNHGSLSVENSVTPEWSQQLLSMPFGSTSKKNKLLSGFGLINAREIALQYDSKIEIKSVGSRVIFSVKPN